MGPAAAERWPAFHEATRRVNAKPGSIGGESHVPLVAPLAMTSRSTSSTTPASVPLAKAAAEPNRVNWRRPELYGPLVQGEPFTGHFNK